MGDDIGWKVWLKEEKEMFENEFGYDRYGEIEKWWTKVPEQEPIIVVQLEDGTYYTWDGAHRVGISFKNNIITIPAFVGIPKIQTTK